MSDAIAGAGGNVGDAAIGRGSGNNRAIYSKNEDAADSWGFFAVFLRFFREKIGSEAVERCAGRRRSPERGGRGKGRDGAAAAAAAAQGEGGGYLSREG